MAQTLIQSIRPIARLLVSGIFLYAGVSKIVDPGAFAMDIAHYRILPQILGTPLAFFLPWLEVFSAVALWVPAFQKGALTLLWAMMLVFVIALLSSWARGLNPDCGCFGRSHPTTIGKAIGRDTLILLLLYCSTISWDDWHTRRLKVSRRLLFK